MPLDAHAGRLVRMLSLGAARDAAADDLPRRRAAFRELMRLSEIGSVAASQDRLIPGPAGRLAIRLYTPVGAPPGPLPGLVFMHGGGFVCGGLDTHDGLCRTLCEQAECRVIAVDYRLAPEHPFPAAVEDAYAATLWVLDHAAELGLGRTRIGIAGDSVGAAHAAAVCALAQTARPGALALQLLLCPLLDWAADTDSRRAFAQGYLLDRAAMARELACYLGDGGDAAHPHVSPLRADLRGRPPAHIHTAEFDPARDEGAAYADKLRHGGVAVHHTCHGGMPHLFYGFGQVVPRAREALQRIGAEVRAALAEGALSHV
jgi:acetyl esterase/lipase